MKTPSIVNALLFASAITYSVPLHAQNIGPTVSATVPFGFELGVHHFSPGTYTIARPFEGILAVRNRSDRGMVLARWEISTKRTEKAKVVFHRYGNRYYLREVWPSSSLTHLECAESKQERQARRAEVAVVPSAPTNVELALSQTPSMQP